MLLLGGCSSPTPHHSILGTTSGFNIPEKNVTVVRDIQINTLRIRQVRLDSTSCVSGSRHHLELLGPIGPDSTAVVGRILDELPECRNIDGTRIASQVYLSSGGGSLSDGFKLGELFRKHQVHTFVTYHQQCSSSCAIAFLGGKYRDMEGDAKLLFHAPYTYGAVNRYSDSRSINCSDYGQVAELKRYYVKFLGKTDGEFLLDRTLDYCSAEAGWSINVDAAKLFGITTG
jgi:hypothetical protein